MEPRPDAFVFSIFPFTLFAIQSLFVPSISGALEIVVFYFIHVFLRHQREPPNLLVPVLVGVGSLSRNRL